MTTQGLQLSYFILLATAIYLQTIYGQAIRSHDLCVDDTVTVSVNSTGVIHHVQRDSRVSPCTLLLSGFVSGSYVYMPGVNAYTSGCGLSTNITINNAMYCVKGNQSTNTAIVKLTSDQLTITLPSTDVLNFTLQYYNNIGVCGTDIALTDRTEVNQLSGVISTSYDDSPTVTNECTVRLIGLPNPPVFVRFNLLYRSNLPYPLHIGDKNFSNTSPVGSTLLVTTSSERSIIVTYLPDDNSQAGFVLTFSVVHCGDIPAIPNTTNTTTDTPWLPDAKVTYECVDGWKSDTQSTIECIVDRSKEIAVWSDHSNIQCIPEPWCHSPPTSVDNSTYRLGGDNLTATYQCIDGYTTNSSVSDRTINCTTSDRDTTPWTWTSANFKCDAVECELSAEYQNITNGEVTDKKYSYAEQLEYQCDAEYVRGQVVNCTKDGNWSAFPSCVPAPTTTSKSESIGSNQSEINTTTTTTISVATSMSVGALTDVQIIIIAGVGGLVVLAVVVSLVVYFCTRKTQSANSQSKRDLTDSTAAANGTDNPYHDLEPPDVIPATNNLSAGAYDMVVLDDSNQHAEVSAPAARAKPKPPSKRPSSRPVEQPQGDIYAELKGKTALKAPRRHVPLFTSTEPVYADTPDLPAKLDEVVFEENTLYEGYGAAAQATAQQAGNQSNVEMMDNALYERY